MQIPGMKKLLLPAILFLISCGQSNEKTEEAPDTAQVKSATSANEDQAGGIVGEWEQQYTAFDKNGNYTMEPEEKKASGTHLGFNWFKFNADGTCLRDKDIQFKGQYEIQEKNSTRKLVIRGGDELRYTILELNENELILGADGAFIVFKRIK
jgi:hypothetical protein